MEVLDADAQLEECVDIWSYIDNEFYSHVTDRLGDDFIMTVTDYPHGDGFRQDKLSEGLEQRGDLPARTIEKILSDNPQRFDQILAHLRAH
jgi:hypothetical protein